MAGPPTGFAAPAQRGCLVARQRAVPQRLDQAVPDSSGQTAEGRVPCVRQSLSEQHPVLPVAFGGRYVSEGLKALF